MTATNHQIYYVEQKLPLTTLSLSYTYNNSFFLFKFSWLISSEFWEIAVFVVLNNQMKRVEKRVVNKMNRQTDRKTLRIVQHWPIYNTTLTTGQKSVSRTNDEGSLAVFHPTTGISDFGNFLFFFFFLSWWWRLRECGGSFEIYLMFSLSIFLLSCISSVDR